MVLMTWAKFLQPSCNYCDQLYLHLWHKKYFWLHLWRYGPGLIWDYISHCSVHFSNNTWNNAQCVGAPTNMIQPITVAISNGLNFFVHMIYAFQTSTYFWNSAKLLLIKMKWKLITLFSKELKKANNLIFYLPNPFAMTRIWYKVNFKEGITGLNWEFSFS